MFRSICLIVLLFVTIILVGCGGAGSGSTGQSQGATVSLQAQVTQGKATIVFSQYSSTDKIGDSNPSMNFTLKSIGNSNAGLMVSDVNITSETITYEYIDSTPSNLGVNLSIPPLTYFSNLIVPVNGTIDWQNVPVLTAAQKKYLKDNDVLSSASNQLRYIVRVIFNGVEVKNGTHISVSTTGTLILHQ